MTRAISANLLTSFGAEEIPVCWLMEIAMPDGTYKRANSLGTVDIVYNSNTYSGFPGFDVSSVTFTDGDGAPAVDLTHPLGTVGPITWQNAASGLISGLAVRLWIYEFDNGYAHEIGSKWYIGSIQTNDAGMAVFEVKSASRRNKQLFLRRYEPKCQHQLGDSGCGVNLASYTETVTVATNPDLFTLTVTASSSPVPVDDIFNNGAIKFTSGPLQGTSYDVRDWVSSTGTVRLFSPLKGVPAAGNTATIHQGCDKTTGAAGCSRFSNIERFFGFRYLPDENLTVPQVTTDGSDTSGTAQPSGGGGVWYGGVADGGFF